MGVILPSFESQPVKCYPTNSFFVQWSDIIPSK
jgi:hypothetical protein